MLLFGAYTLSGAIFTGKFKKKRGSDNDAEVAAAIAVALEQYAQQSKAAKPAASQVITIKESSSAWADKSRGMRKTPRLK